jgi:hypothetical protein
MSATVSLSQVFESSTEEAKFLHDNSGLEETKRGMCRRSILRSKMMEKGWKHVAGYVLALRVFHWQPRGTNGLVPLSEQCPRFRPSQRLNALIETASTAALSSKLAIRYHNEANAWMYVQIDLDI